MLCGPEGSEHQMKEGESGVRVGGHTRLACFYLRFQAPGIPTAGADRGRSATSLSAHGVGVTDEVSSSRRPGLDLHSPTNFHDLLGM